MFSGADSGVGVRSSGVGANADLKASTLSCTSGVKTAGTPAATRYGGLRFAASDPSNTGKERKKSPSLNASAVLVTKLLRKWRVPMPSMMSCGERKTKSRRTMEGSWVAITGQTTKSVATLGAGGSELAQSAPVWPVVTTWNVFSSHARVDASSGMVRYDFFHRPSRAS